MNIILLSGGSGERLWPLSDNVRSKQFLKVLKNHDGRRESMFQRVYRMLREVDESAFITIAASEGQVDLIKKQINFNNNLKLNISVEPCRRDTFPAIVLAAAYLCDIKNISEDEAVIVCPVDPYVEREYFLMLKELYNYAKNFNSKIALMGIEPTYPSAKYGYIIPENKDKISKVLKFKEKPDEITAKKYIEQGALWNGGVFAFKLRYILDKAREIFDFNNKNIYKKIYDKYAALPKISFDYAVLEKEANIDVMRFSGAWRDLGTWNTLTEAMADYNSGSVKTLNCANTHIINELDAPLIALGVKDLAIVATSNGILVTEKSSSDKLRDLVKNLKV